MGNIVVTVDRALAYDKNDQLVELERGTVVDPKLFPKTAIDRLVTIGAAADEDSLVTAEDAAASAEERAVAAEELVRVLQSEIVAVKAEAEAVKTELAKAKADLAAKQAPSK